MVLLTMVTLFRYIQFINNRDESSTLLCLFEESVGFLGAYIDYRWSAITEVVYAASKLMLLLGVLDFVCTQVMYAMKGLETGTSFVAQ